MTSPTIATGELTSADLRELRKSRSVAFYARWQEGELTESRIVGRDRDAANNDYVRAQLEVPSSLQYGGSIVRENADVRAYMSVLSAQFHEHWNTAVNLLRAGDRLVMMWSANGGRNDILREAGFAVDELSIRVVRGKRQMWFHVDQRISRYNSARTFTIGDTYNPVTSDRDREISA